MDTLSSDGLHHDGSFDITSSIIHSDVSSSCIFGSFIESPGSVFRSSSLEFSERLDEDDLFNHIQGPSASSVESKTRRRKASQPQRLVYCDTNDEPTPIKTNDTEFDDDKIFNLPNGDVREFTQLVRVGTPGDMTPLSAPIVCLPPIEKPLVELKCQHCDESFQDKVTLENHRRQSHVKSSSNHRAQCAICGLSVFNKSALRNHMKRIHEKQERLFKCTICSKSFLSKTELTSHEFTHSNEKNFSCTTCGKRFKSKMYLEKHQKTHVGVKPFKCDFCGKQLKDKTGFVAHVRGHSGERPYSCPMCDKRYTIKRHLTSHLRIHSNARPFKCEVVGCGKTFRSRSNLRMHKDFHAGVKRWSCSFCGRSFLSQGNMAKHIRRHIGDKKYSCDVCGKAFIEKQELRNHQRVHVNRNHFVRMTSTGESIESTESLSTPTTPTTLTPINITRSSSFSTTTTTTSPDFCSVSQSSNDNNPCELSSRIADAFSVKTNTYRSMTHGNETSPPTTTSQMVTITLIHDGQNQHHEQHTDGQSIEHESHATATCQLLSHPSSVTTESNSADVVASHVVESIANFSTNDNGNDNFTATTSPEMLSTSSDVHSRFTTIPDENNHHLSEQHAQPVSVINIGREGGGGEIFEKLPSLGFPYQTMSDQVYNCTLCSNYYPEATMLRQHLIDYHRVEHDKIH